MRSLTARVRSSRLQSGGKRSRAGRAELVPPEVHASEATEPAQVQVKNAAALFSSVLIRIYDSMLRSMIRAHSLDQNKRNVANHYDFSVRFRVCMSLRENH